MSFRNRPVLDRKHRPRWQDELRTQQLIVASFAIAIAVAIMRTRRMGGLLLIRS